MCHIHTSIVSRHPATPPPHISSSEEILPRLTRHTLTQLKTNKSPFIKSYYTKSTPNHIHHHYTPSVTHTYMTHLISSTAPTYAPHCHPWICEQTPPKWLRSWLLDHKLEDRTPPPPLARVMGVGRHQQQEEEKSNVE